MEEQEKILQSDFKFRSQGDVFPWLNSIHGFDYGSVAAESYKLLTFTPVNVEACVGVGAVTLFNKTELCELGRPSQGLDLPVVQTSKSHWIIARAVVRDSRERAVNLEGTCLVSFAHKALFSWFDVKFQGVTELANER
jgi:hypothetical protein